MTMLGLRNFRIILDVDPDSARPHCVGVRKDGGPCRLPMSNESDRPQASALLTEMDGQTLKDSYSYLEELAFLTLCRRCHRKPGHSQVGIVVMRWAQKIQQVEKEEAELARILRSRQTNARNKGAIQELKVAVRKERTKMIPVIRHSLQKNNLSITDKTLNLVDPFIDSKSLVHESVSETAFTRRHKASKTRTSETSSPSHNTSLQQSTKLDIRNASPTISARISTLPSPPDTPPASRQGNRQDTEDEDERLSILANGFETEATEPADTSKPFNSHSFFDPIEGSQQSSTLSIDLAFQQPVAPPCYCLESPRITLSIPQQRESFRLGHHRITPATSNFETPLSSSFTTWVSEVLATMSDKASTANIDLDSEFKNAGMERIDNEVQEMHAAESSKQSEVNKDVLDITPAAMMPIEGSIAPAMPEATQGDDLPQTPGQPVEEENFGYAVITSSTRARSFKPATQRYGLVTPPEEPNLLDTPARAIKLNTRTIDNDRGLSYRPVATTPPWISQGRPFMIPRKPVNPAFRPVPPAKPMGQQTAAQFGGRRNEAMKSAYGHTKKPVKIEIRDCSSDSDVSVHAGCLHAFGIITLREKVVHKVRNKVQHIRMRRLFRNTKVTVTQ